MHILREVPRIVNMLEFRLYNDLQSFGFEPARLTSTTKDIFTSPKKYPLVLEDIMEENEDLNEVNRSMSIYLINLAKLKMYAVDPLDMLLFKCIY